MMKLFFHLFQQSAIVSGLGVNLFELVNAALEKFSLFHINSTFLFIVVRKTYFPVFELSRENTATKPASLTPTIFLYENNCSTVLIGEAYVDTYRK